MMKNLISAALVAAAVAAAPLCAAQDNTGLADLAAMTQAARKDKRALVAEKLALTPAEAKKFWPVFDNLQKDLARLNRERNVSLETLVNRDRPPSDAYAKQVVNDLMSIEEQEVRAMRKASNASMRALPPRKAARYMQIENKLRAVQDYEIAVAFPLAQ
jgi:Spy/CpxP family protein refolding chaperone